MPDAVTEIDWEGIQGASETAFEVAIRGLSEGLRAPVKASYSKFQSRYRHDPSGFIKDCVDFGVGGPTSYQLEIPKVLVKHGRVAVRSPHGAGKTALAALVVLWFALTRDGVSDWKIPMTASAWRQLTHYLLPEIHKMARRLRWDRIGRGPFSRMELKKQSLQLSTGEAFAMASDNYAFIEGAHSSSLLVIFDEAKAIPAATYDAIEGAFSTAGPDTADEAFALAISTPGEAQGRFYEIHSRNPGYEDWKTRHITLDEAIEAGRISREWAENRRRQWGEGSALYKNRVEGEFQTADDEGVIPLSWVEAANERWYELNELDEWGVFTCLGADIARSGASRNVIAERYGPAIRRVYTIRSHGDTMSSTGHIVSILNQRGGYAVIDVIGIGAGVVDRAREMGRSGSTSFTPRDIIPFNASERTTARDRTGELSFVNKRAHAWWHLRELLDPANGFNIALPPDEVIGGRDATLTGDLVSPKWKVNSSGRIQIESKKNIQERIGRSTDFGDAVVEAFYPVRLRTWKVAYAHSQELDKEVRL